MSRAQTAKRLRLARERKVISQAEVSVRRSIMMWCEQPKRAIFDADGKSVSDSRKYVEVEKRERLDEERLLLKMADGTAWLVTVELMP